MTCIVAIAQDGKVYMGADSASVGGWTLQQSKEPKLFRVGTKKNALLFGGSGSFRSIQIARYLLKLEPQTSAMTDFEYMVVHVSEQMRLLFKEHGLSKIDSNVEDEPDTQFLVGYRGHLYMMEPCHRFQIVQFQSDYAACGGGECYAFGALAATTGQRQAISRIERVLKAVCTHYIGASPPFVIEVLE